MNWELRKQILVLCIVIASIFLVTEKNKCFELYATEIINFGYIGKYKSIKGKVMEYGGTPIAKASIKIHSKDYDNVKVCESNKEGIFNCSNLPSGKYEVIVEALGYDVNQFNLTLNPKSILASPKYIIIKMQVGCGGIGAKVFSSESLTIEKAKD